MLFAALVAAAVFASPPVAAGVSSPGQRVQLVRPVVAAQPVVALRSLRLAWWWTAPGPRHVSRADALAS